MMASEISFIDTNIFLYATAYRKEDILTWIHRVYQNIYVHVDVLEELEIPSERKRIEKFIGEHKWTIFDPTNLQETEYDTYHLLRSQVASDMLMLNKNRRRRNEPVKQTANTGEISILAACLLINGTIICSNDGDVHDLIDQEEYLVLDDVTQQDVPIRQEDLIDFCVKVQSAGVATRKEVRKFYSAIIGKQNNRETLIQMLDGRMTS